MELADDLEGITTLMRMHVEIRNYSRFKKVYRNSFVARNAVQFLLNQGLVDDREEAVDLCQMMIDRGLMLHARDKDDSKKRPFTDGGDLYRFTEDMNASSFVAQNGAGNGDVTHTGKLGCKFSFASHTCHNSLILDLSLAEEIETAVAQGDMVMRKAAFEKLRARVKEQVGQGASEWDLTQSIAVGDIPMSVYRRQRPWGVENTRMDGTLAESPLTFVNNILRFSQRSKWESDFDDGVGVESIEIEGEKESMLSISEEALSSRIESRIRADRPRQSRATPGAENTDTGNGTGTGKSSASMLGDGSSSQRDNSGVEDSGSRGSYMNDPLNLQNPNNLVNSNINDFLSTVDLAGIPENMSVGYLNDPGRQTALSHLRKQMMASMPDQCMLCNTDLATPGDIRFCPCCAMVACAACVSRRVFELSSRTIVSVRYYIP